MVGFVLELVKSARLDGLNGFFLIAGIRNVFLDRLFCTFTFIFIFVLFLFLIFLYVLGRTRTILRARHRNTLSFESFLDLWELFEERGELLDVERNSL